MGRSFLSGGLDEALPCARYDLCSVFSPVLDNSIPLGMGVMFGQSMVGLGL